VTHALGTKTILGGLPFALSAKGGAVLRWPLHSFSFFAYDFPVSTACTPDRYGNRWQQNPSGFPLDTVIILW